MLLLLENTKLMAECELFLNGWPFVFFGRLQFRVLDIEI
jgi:hypothetical protein